MRICAILSFGLLCACGNSAIPGGDLGPSFFPLPDLASPDLAPAISADTACTDASTAYCNAVNTCAPFLLEYVYGDLATCQTRFKLGCSPTLAANGTSRTAAELDACARAATAATCNDLFTGNIAACNAVPGTLANGIACVDSNQCTSAYCNRGAGACGACAPTPALGDKCNGDCGTSGFQCDTNVCVSYAALGGSCDGNTHKCTPGLYCNPTTAMCATPLGAGTTCDPNTKNPPCDLLHGLFCNPLSKVCTQVKFAGPNEACGYVAPDFVACSGAGICKMATGAFMGHCLGAAADGAACDPVNGPGCLSPAVCSSGLCRLSDPSSCH